MEPTSAHEQNDAGQSLTRADGNLLRVGCAGWNIPKVYTEQFLTEGTHLERYARVFPAAEINSSFYRPHKPSSYEKWANSVHDDFRFSVKVPKIITHSHRLRDVSDLLGDFLGECGSLGPKLGPLLVQLPPSLVFDGRVVSLFFSVLRQQFPGNVACEPRHASWFAPEPNALLNEYRVARVAADPSVVPEAAEPGGWDGLVYYRLHGSPRIYYSAYSPQYLHGVAQKLSSMVGREAQAWCIFDNTAEGAATGDALAILRSSP